MFRMNMKLKGIGIMIAWVLWVILFIVSIEITERKFRKKIFDMNVNYLNG
jgi:hypothetical protein